MENVTADKVVVYCLDAYKLLKNVNKAYQGTLGGNRSIATNAAYEGLIMVPGGYINVDTDCCYSYSITEMRTRGNNIDITERIAIDFRIEERTKVLTGTYTNTVLRFRKMFDCSDLIKNYSLPETKSLKEFMGSRFNYNPRISKNVSEFITEVRELTKSELLNVG